MSGPSLLIEFKEWRDGDDAARVQLAPAQWDGSKATGLYKTFTALFAYTAR
jgi:hypothetical protein